MNSAGSLIGAPYAVGVTADEMLAQGRKESNRASDFYKMYNFVEKGIRMYKIVEECIGVYRNV